MDLFDTMKSSLFGDTKSDGVEPVKETSKITGQIQDNFKFLTDIAKDMTSISESVKSLVELKGGMPATDANLDTTPEQVPEVEVEKKKKGFKMPKGSTIMKILGGVLALGSLVTIFWDDIKKAFDDFVKNLYPTIKEKFMEFVSDLGKWFSGIADTAMEKFKELKDKLVENITKMFSGIGEWVGGKIETIAKFFKPVTDFISESFEGFKDTLRSAVLSVPGALVPDALEEFLGVTPGVRDDEKRKEKIREQVTRELKRKGELETGFFGGVKDTEENNRKIEEAFQRRLKAIREIQKESGVLKEPAEKEPIPEGKSSESPKNVSKVSGDEDIKAMIIGHEGVRNQPYKDSLGLWTVGVGHLIGNGKTLPKDADRVYSDSEIAEMFEIDYAHHKKIAERTPGYNEANDAGKGAMIDLAFNMGKWWPKWPNTSKALKEGNFEAAARGLEDSKWYGQVGNRAPTIVSLIESAGDQSGGSDLSVASAAIGAGQRAMSKPKTPNVIDNSQVNNTVVVKNETVNREESIDLTSEAMNVYT